MRVKHEACNGTAQFPIWESSLIIFLTLLCLSVLIGKMGILVPVS